MLVICGVGLACYEEVKSILERKCAFLRGKCQKGRQIGFNFCNILIPESHFMDA